MSKRSYTQQLHGATRKNNGCAGCNEPHRNVKGSLHEQTYNLSFVIPCDAF